MHVQDELEEGGCKNLDAEEPSNGYWFSSALFVRRPAITYSCIR